MAKVLRDEAVPNDTGLAIELHLPQSSKRIDFTLTGHGEAGEKNAVLVELKQWSSSKLSEKDAIVVTALGKGLNETVHPSYQAWSYTSLLEGFNEAVYERSIALRPCAYLHNYARDGVIDAPHYQPYIDKAPPSSSREKTNSSSSEPSFAGTSTPATTKPYCTNWPMAGFVRRKPWPTPLRVY